jgi:hypothetical protein
MGGLSIGFVTIPVYREAVSAKQYSQPVSRPCTAAAATFIDAYQIDKTSLSVEVLW